MEEAAETIRPRGKNKKRNRKQKINLVFDAAKRKDFLTGFHKRKLQRKKKALEEFQEKLKEEKRRIKQESKEAFKKLVVSHRPIPELEKLLENEYENDDVTVKIVELSTDDIAQKQNWIGQNRPRRESDDEPESSDGDVDGEEELPGMELTKKSEKTPTRTLESKPVNSFKSEKEVKKIIKKQATKNVQKSKTFNKKFKMEQIKNRKTSKRLNHSKMKFKSKKGKMRHRMKWKKSQEG